jgi:hypothetical protein
MAAVVLTVGASAALFGVALGGSRSLLNTPLRIGLLSLPADLRNVTALAIKNLIVPCVLLLLCTIIKDTGCLMVGIPYLMRSKDVLENVNGKTPEDTKALKDGIAKLVIARQTFFRLHMFMIVAILMSMAITGLGAKQAIPELIATDWPRVASDIMRKFR